MGRFFYKAISNSSQHVSGTIEAADRKSAISTLTEKGEFVTELTQKSHIEPELENETTILGLLQLFAIKPLKPSSKDILAITGQLSAALGAGLELLDALKIIEQQQTKPAIKKLLADIINSVNSGESLSGALSKHKNVFSPLYISMVRVGETGGILDSTTAQLVSIYSREESIKTSMKNASAYPLLVLTVGLLSVIVIITWILPNILSTISGGVDVLPWPTRVLLTLSDLLKSFGLVFLIILVLGVTAFRKWINTSGRLAWDSFKLKIPVLNSVLRSIAVGRFAKTLGALTKGGVAILESLSIVRDTLGNEVLARQIDLVAEEVKSGSSLATPLGESGFFPPLLVQIVAVGEETGKLDELLINAADTFDQNADNAIERFIAIFPAILILLLALVIGFIIAATLLPIIIMELGGTMI